MATPPLTPCMKQGSKKMMVPQHDGQQQPSPPPPQAMGERLGPGQQQPQGANGGGPGQVRVRWMGDGKELMLPGSRCLLPRCSAIGKMMLLPLCTHYLLPSHTTPTPLPLLMHTSGHRASSNGSRTPRAAGGESLPGVTAVQIDHRLTLSTIG